MNKMQREGTCSGVGLCRPEYIPYVPTSLHSWSVRVRSDDEFMMVYRLREI